LLPFALRDFVEFDLLPFALRDLVELHLFPPLRDFVELRLDERCAMTAPLRSRAPAEDVHTRGPRPKCGKPCLHVLDSLFSPEGEAKRPIRLTLTPKG
jgi:hypothetical protein